MIEINLLPKELKKKKIKLELPNIKFTPIIIGVVAFIVFVQLVLSVTLMIKKGYTLKRLEAKWTVFEPKSKELLAMNEQLESLTRKVKNIDSLVAKRLSWTKKLNDLSDLMTPGVWLNSLSIDEVGGRKILSLKGSVSSSGMDEAALIGKFMKNLKENKSFFKDFSEIALGTIQKTEV